MLPQGRPAFDEALGQPLPLPWARLYCRAQPPALLPFVEAE